MPDSVVPDPEFAPAADLSQRRAARAVDAVQAIAEREASLLISTSAMQSTEQVHRVLVIAFLKGYVLGGGEVLGALDDVLGEHERTVRS